MTRTEYNTIHQYHLRKWTKNGICEQCRRATRTQWANRTGRYIKDYRSDWLELCAKCHHQFDIKYNHKAQSSGRPRKPWLEKQKELAWYSRFIADILRMLQYDWM